MRFIFLCCCLYGQHLFAQPGFNKGYDYGYFINYFFDVSGQADTIVAYGLAQDTTWPYQQGVFIARFDTLGTPIDNVLVLDTTNNIYSIDKSWGKLITTADGGYAMTTATLYGRDGVFIKLDHQLDITFVQRYRDTINQGEFLVAPIEIPEGYLLYGYYNYASNMKFDAILRKVDKQGNLIWRRNIGVVDRHEAFASTVMLNDSLILLNGSKYADFPDWYPTGVPWVYVINQAGDLVYEWEAASPESFNGLRIGRLIPQIDGGWLANGLEYLGLHPEYGYKRYQTYWVKLDHDFQYLWSKPFGPNNNPLDLLLKIIQTPDHEILGFGQRGPFDQVAEGFYQKGRVMRFSAEADSLWEWTGKMPAPNPGAHFFSGGALLSSGSIIAAGSGEDANGKNYCWLVKLSPNGCIDTLFCHPITSIPAPPVSSGIKVFPNPAAETLHIACPDRNVLNTRLIDITGRTVLRNTLQPGMSEQSISVREIKPGIYFLEAMLDSGVTVKTKIAVQR